jgi:predicted ester cyclase
VRRFIKEVLDAGELDRMDDLLAPDYVNRAFDTDLTTFKGMIAALVAALPDRRYDIEELVAEGDAVVARFAGEMSDGAGTQISLRGLTYYRLADGKIVEDDPFSTPDLAEQIGALVAPASA